MELTYIDIINEYYIHNRQVGHTRAVMYGAIPSEAIVLVHNSSMARLVKQTYQVETIVMGSPRHLAEKLRGRNKPLLIDNAAWIEISRNMHETIRP